MYGAIYCSLLANLQAPSFYSKTCYKNVKSERIQYHQISLETSLIKGFNKVSKPSFGKSLLCLLKNLTFQFELCIYQELLKSLYQILFCLGAVTTPENSTCNQFFSRKYCQKILLEKLSVNCYTVYVYRCFIACLSFYCCSLFIKKSTITQKSF